LGLGFELPVTEPTMQQRAPRARLSSGRSSCMVVGGGLRLGVGGVRVAGPLELGQKQLH